MTVGWGMESRISIWQTSGSYGLQAVKSKIGSKVSKTMLNARATQSDLLADDAGTLQSWRSLVVMIC